ncbi:hypothetical protein SKAU_G00147360 [Synaphobranchus kaupii]|uniref:Ewing's tumor-associated antigen 1 n=1 Tax=Synaphobranchus kaupii TaxID=118154 RepID=A0A9Q1FTG5_SYNKA|nr:hypothetical protein SKAU_G00147360 [Synaphobranchus kaupii]
MNERRKQHSDLSEDSEAIRTKLSQNKLKTNRLSRSLRQTQQTQRSPSFDSSYNCHKEFKTPKRHTRIRPCASHNADSPSNDSDLQQDIIWDPTSPTAVWNGKGVKKSSTNVRAVDISEIVNRIAPKNERPVVPESALLQWIGDSAVPCTPEVPRTRKKSTRQNDVEDLMKLAKQFDFNMYQQDKEQVKAAYQRSVKQDTDDLREPGGLENNPPPALSEVATTSRGSASQMLNCGKRQSMDQKPPDQEMEDGFDALFDRSTQRISGRLSQASSSHSQEEKAASKDAVFGSGSELGPGNQSAGSSASVKMLEMGLKTPPSNRFVVDDDWDNDDLLNDSIVLAMTQNPDLFATPKYCSTQTGPSPKQSGFIQKPSAGNGAPGQLPKANSGNGVDGPCQGKNPRSKNRSTFKLETNPNFHVKETLSGEEPNSYRSLENSKPGQQGGLQGRPKGLLQPPRATPLEPSNRNNLNGQTVPGGERVKGVQKPVVQQSSSTSSGSRLARPAQVGDWASSARGAESAKGGKRAGNTEPVGERPVDAMDEDLESIFASDSLWDDGDDDDMLCQVCDDVEKLSQSQPPGAADAGLDRPCVAPTGLKITPPSVAVKGAAAQSVYAGNQGQATGRNQSTFSRSNSMPGGTAAFPKYAPGVKPPASGSLVGNNAVSTANCAPSSSSCPQAGSGNRRGPYKFTQVKKMSAMEAANSGAPAAPRYAGNASSARNPSASHQPSFKRHLSDPMALTNKVFVPNQVAVKCSEAEIERKKQEALARRRLRMQMSQKQGGPT